MQQHGARLDAYRLEQWCVARRWTLHHEQLAGARLLCGSAMVVRMNEFRNIRAEFPVAAATRDADGDRLVAMTAPRASGSW